MIAALWRKWFGPVEPLPLMRAKRFLPLLQHVSERHNDVSDIETEALFSADLVRRAVEWGLIRWAAHSLPDYEFYELTRLGEATLRAHQPTS